MQSEFPKTRGFSLLEIIVALTIVMIVMGGVVWNMTGLKAMGNTHYAVHRAAMLGTAKQAFCREKGALAQREYEKNASNEGQFQCICHLLPYAGSGTTLESYTPEGFRFEMNDLHAKVGIFQEPGNIEINY